MKETNMTTTYTLTQEELKLLWKLWDEIQDETSQLGEALSDEDIDEAKECEMRLTHAVALLFHAIPVEREST